MHLVRHILCLQEKLSCINRLSTKQHKLFTLESICTAMSYFENCRHLKISFIHFCNDCTYPAGFTIQLKRHEEAIHNKMFLQAIFTRSNARPPRHRNLCQNKSFHDGGTEGLPGIVVCTAVQILFGIVLARVQDQVNL